MYPFRWNSWNFFACDIDESLIKETGTFLLSNPCALCVLMTESLALMFITLVEKKHSGRNEAENSSL